MRFEELWICHGRMTAPAEKGDISPEQNISGPVLCRVRFYLMTEETNRPPVQVEYIATAVQHDVRIDLRIFFLSMTLIAELPQVDIRTSTQEIYVPSSVVLNVAGQTHYFPVIKRERVVGRMRRNNTDRVMIFPVFIAFKAFRRQIGSCQTSRGKRLHGSRWILCSQHTRIAGYENNE
jgi:hypothetical protein